MAKDWIVQNELALMIVLGEDAGLSDMHWRSDGHVREHPLCIHMSKAVTKRVQRKTECKIECKIIAGLDRL